MWVRLKKGPKIPLLWFLLGMGLNEKMIFQSVVSPNFLLKNFQQVKLKTSKKQQRKKKNTTTDSINMPLIENYQDLENFFKNKLNKKVLFGELKDLNLNSLARNIKMSSGNLKYPYVSTTPEAWKEIAKLFDLKKIRRNSKKDSAHKEFFLRNFNSSRPKIKSRLIPLFHKVEEPQSNIYVHNYKTFFKSNKILSKNRIKETSDYATLGRKWFFQRFMNPRTYDLGKKGRLALNKKLGLTISNKQTTLTAQDLLFITNYLMKVEKGISHIDDIDHLKNKRIRSAGELIQMQFGIGLMRLEKAIRLKLNIKSKKKKFYSFKKKTSLNSIKENKKKF
jgi:DNA-directed RNA polymerase beta subunit